MVESGKEPKKQERKAPGRKQMISLWIAVATALGSQGIPKIVELLENKPSVEDVQAMIARQTEALTKAQNKAVDVIQALDARIHELAGACAEHRTITGQLEERTELLKEILRDCCTRQHIRKRLEKIVRLPETEDGMKVEKVDINKRPSTTAGKSDAADMVQKVPEFNAQQQLQTQAPMER